MICAPGERREKVAASHTYANWVSVYGIALQNKKPPVAEGIEPLRF